MRAEVVVQTQFANCFGPQMCLSGLWQHQVATETHLWLSLSNIKRKDKNFLMDATISPSGLFGDAVNLVFERFQELPRKAAVFQKLLPRHTHTHLRGC